MKTEQEVREAITIQDALIMADGDEYCIKHLDESVKILQNLSVIIGKALGVVE